ncbi:MAG: hypothetical protein VB142_03955 [Burkholderia sp.]
MMLDRIDAQHRLSMIYDQGRGMPRHEQRRETTGIKVYFAIRIALGSASATRMPSRLLRQSMPKGMDLAVFSKAELDDIAWQMNTHLRKSLDWMCPAELFMPESFDVSQHHHEIVALGDALRAQRASVALQP